MYGKDRKSGRSHPSLKEHESGTVRRMKKGFFFRFAEAVRSRAFMVENSERSIGNEGQAVAGEIVKKALVCFK